MVSMPDLARAMREAAEGLFILRLGHELGEGYSSIVVPLLRSIRAVHDALSTERLGSGVYICMALDVGGSPEGGQGIAVDSAAQLMEQHDSSKPFTVLIEPSGFRMRVWRAAPQAASIDRFLVYRYLGAYRESFVAAGVEIGVPVVSGFPSFFSMPYFLELRDALLHHGRHCIRYSQCEIFARSWRDESRLVHLPKPEWLMRRSMQTHLRCSLRDHSDVTIMPEQNVDEAKRVDIKVTWMNSNRVGLIEIKWLGASAAVGADSFSQRYSAARAREGARQLIGYMDRYRAEAPHEEARGFLVVYDARRARLRPDSTSLSRDDALAYKHSEIDYYGLLGNRDDIDDPIRLFSFPVSAG